MDELIDIVDSQGKPTGTIALKSEAHKNGLYHNTIHLWLFTENGEIVLQQRSKKKKIYPLLWDVSVAGHIDAGESFETAAIRECQEEIGLDLTESELIKIGTHLHESIYDDGKVKDFEFHQIYIAKLNKELNSLKPQPDEVEALKLVTFNEFENLLESSENNSHFIASNTSYYQFVLNTIKSQIQ
ncbi:MAG: NUDIX domain-containing protein [Winogradskyella sp.]|uniref:NUDIX hydrolase n=1 Tax=Winogradskyella sp. TaxID=1883156 RepID=UPI000F40E970|nr:NUDIX domain-containing protein [Winogradskyella sp.]RNC86394.1 MAG: NUDIX domain-containing protein [Winogradskyella sp.]